MRRRGRSAGTWMTSEESKIEFQRYAAPKFPEEASVPQAFFITAYQLSVFLQKKIWKIKLLAYFCSGEMAEWSIASVLKTEDCHRSGGSNPSLSAESDIKSY